MTDKTPPLLPCPFCGSAAQMHQVPKVDGDDNAGGYYIECDNRACSMTTALRFSCGDDCRPALIETWNRRAPDTQVAPSPPPRREGHSKLVYDKATRTIVTERTPVAPDSLVADIERRNLTDEPPCSCGGVDTPYGHGHTGNCSVMVIHDLRIYLKRAESRLERVTQALETIAAWDCLNPPRADLLADLPWLRKVVDDAIRAGIEP